MRCWCVLGALWAAASVAAGGENSLSSLRTFKDPQTTVVVQQGERFRLVLPSNRTTGYQWQFAQPLDAAHLKLLKTDYVERRAPRIVGAGGEQVWLLKALAKGRTTVRLEYVRSWEKAVPPDKRADFEIQIRRETTKEPGLTSETQIR